MDPVCVVKKVKAHGACPCSWQVDCHSQPRLSTGHPESLGKRKPQLRNDLTSGGPVAVSERHCLSC